MDHRPWTIDQRPKTMDLSAAQEQPIALLVTTALVADMPLCRAALNGVTLSPTGKMMFGSVVEQFEGRTLDQSQDLRFRRRFCKIIRQRGACAMKRFLEPETKGLKPQTGDHKPQTLDNRVNSTGNRPESWKKETKTKDP